MIIWGSRSEIARQVEKTQKKSLMYRTPGQTLELGRFLDHRERCGIKPDQRQEGRYDRDETNPPEVRWSKS